MLNISSVQATVFISTFCVLRLEHTKLTYIFYTLVLVLLQQKLTCVNDYHPVLYDGFSPNKTRGIKDGTVAETLTPNLISTAEVGA